MALSVSVLRSVARVGDGWHHIIEDLNTPALCASTAAVLPGGDLGRVRRVLGAPLPPPTDHLNVSMVLLRPSCRVGDAEPRWLLTSDGCSTFSALPMAAPESWRALVTNASTLLTASTRLASMARLECCNWARDRLSSSANKLRMWCRTMNVRARCCCATTRPRERRTGWLQSGAGTRRCRLWRRQHTLLHEAPSTHGVSSTLTAIDHTLAHANGSENARNS